jgi:erythromycin esterase
MKLIRLDRLMLAGVLGALVACSGESDGPVDPTDPGQTHLPPSTRTSGFPEAWGGSLGTAGGYRIGLDATAHGGAKAAFIASTVSSPSGFATLTQVARADQYRGKRVRWSAWVKHADVQSAGLWLRVDGYTQTLAFDNMASRPITGSADWREVEVVLDVGTNAAGLAFGLLLSGAGDMLLDDMKLAIVDSSVPVTDARAPSGSGDSTQVAAIYAAQRLAPANLDFEGVPTVDPAAVAWLVDNSLSLVTADPGASLDDLTPLGEMIGDARIVGLGEGTHGTREFFRMKHRIFRYLVEQKGFTHFAIEATWPEANEINHYVLTGGGGKTPAQLVRNMHFWTWDTQEVLDLVNWMRHWNTTAPVDKRVQFLGFDMQYPGLAIDTVIAFVQRTNLSNRAFVTQHLSCIARYRNNGGSFVQNPNGYTALSDAEKESCRDSLAQVHKLLKDNEASLEAASSDEEHARALQSARVVQQFERMTAAGSPRGSYIRDTAMAENTDWLLSRAPAGTRIVLWAHNYHVGRTANAMGRHLALKYGADYRNLGFLFGTGLFTAVSATTFRLETMGASLVPNGTLEAHFQATSRLYALLDTRKLTQTAGPTALRAIRMRSIGAVFSSANESAYFAATALPEEYDLLIYVAIADHSRLLP